MNKKDKFWNPYFGGILLGLVLLSAFIFTGKGLGASGAISSERSSWAVARWGMVVLQIRLSVSEMSAAADQA